MSQETKPVIKVERARRRAYQEPAGPETPNVDGPGWGPAPPRPVESEERELERRALEMIRRRAFAAGGLGLVPLPLLDLVGLASMQTLLVRDLTRLFDLEFRPQRARALVAGLLGGAGSVGLAAGVGVSFLKALPVVGATIGAAALPALAGASTYAVGRVFLLHFQTGGTLLDMDPTAMRAYFQKHYQEGRRAFGSQTRK